VPFLIQLQQTTWWGKKFFVRSIQSPVKGSQQGGTPLSTWGPPHQKVVRADPVTLQRVMTTLRRDTIRGRAHIVWPIGLGKRGKSDTFWGSKP
jgi:hypothetical protein